MMLFPRERINNDDELYPQYWSEFESYYPHHGIPLTNAGSHKQAYYFHMEGFDSFKMSLGVYLLDGNSAISANLFLNKNTDKTRAIFEALKSAKAYFERHFEDELLFLSDRPNVFIIGCRKDVDVRDPSDWGNQFQWLCRNLEKLNTVFLPSLMVTQHYEDTRIG